MPESAAPARTLPALDRDSSAYWTGGERGELLIYRCARCRSYVHPPVPFCPNCESHEVAPEPTSGRGRVVTFTINHKAWVPGLQVPYVLALVALEEQDDVRLVCNVIGCEPEAVIFGMAVEAVFEQHGDVWVPMFRPVDSGA